MGTWLRLGQTQFLEQRLHHRVTKFNFIFFFFGTQENFIIFQPALLLGGAMLLGGIEMKRMYTASKYGPNIKTFANIKTFPINF